MEKQLTVAIPNVTGEEGLSIACREGKLFRNDAQLEDLYKDGYRIYNYTVLPEETTDRSSMMQTLVKVFLKK
ncbi:MAG TPA: hypothetical protein VFR58_02890 [Flavisolibacter sp.]|nr:hypothetical protein [Flavisolibacter sp.]